MIQALVPVEGNLSEDDLELDVDFGAVGSSNASRGGNPAGASGGRSPAGPGRERDAIRARAWRARPTAVDRRPEAGLVAPALALENEELMAQSEHLGL